MAMCLINRLTTCLIAHSQPLLTSIRSTTPSAFLMAGHTCWGHLLFQQNTVASAF